MDSAKVVVMPMPRQFLGSEFVGRLADTRVLLVGAGGIGCELRQSLFSPRNRLSDARLHAVKNIVLTGFGPITLLDLDTVDLSNLNRQFLFKKKDVKQSKAMVAAQTAGAFNPNVRIQPIHANIKESQFDVEWFQSFDIVLNALDNLDARRHVSKMCIAAGILLVESGTAGYLGQVQPLLKDCTECSDCIPKPAPKSFPVCTIRSTPPQPIHCIVWAKSYLLPQLFGEDEDGSTELDEAEKQGENAQEIAALRKEALAYKAVRNALRSQQTTDDAAKTVFEKVRLRCGYKNLLSMADMWRSREKPTPLDFDAILDEEPNKITASSSNSKGQDSNGHANGDAVKPSSSDGNGVLKDQRALTLRDNLALFASSTNRLALRVRAGEETIAFDKDDDDARFLHRYLKSPNGRQHHPRYRDHNAIIPGLIVLQTLHLLRKSYTSLKNMHLRFKPAVPLSTVDLYTYPKVQCDPSRVTLSGEDRGTGKRDVSVYEDKRVLSDPDWDDNDDRTLESLGVMRGKFLTIVDEEGEWGTIAVALCELPPNHPTDAPALILPLSLPKPPFNPRRPITPPAPSRKRTAPEDDVAEVEPQAKRAKTNGASSIELRSPSKKKRLEEEGLVMLDSAADKMDNDDVIEIDRAFAVDV
ncbi:hypothetical protein L210DRAFT_3578816 [Boletus edulis BED1]|uniref:THIF-type NAD/FAD binding fold domain-containing protein n=1 Tax=Boletus edulis BED1 TaxID=1328754 RepID=A0AAD4G721_BOLED|nr:hypothetical protein L210DRAFT_3578816 [Boletus edulis BED1]